MRETLVRVLSLGLLAASASCASKSNEEAPPAAESQVRGHAATINTTFFVEAVDTAKRTITLKGPEGKTGTFTVGQEVKRFSEIKPGDSIAVQYHVAVVAEYREPTAEEKANPMQSAQAMSRAPSDVPPSGTLSRGVKVVTTVDAVDPKAGTITLKGPQGKKVTFKADPGSDLSSWKVGMPVIATFGEQLVMTLEPGQKS